MFTEFSETIRDFLFLIFIIFTTTIHVNLLVTRIFFYFKRLWFSCGGLLLSIKLNIVTPWQWWRSGWGYPHHFWIRKNMKIRKTNVWFNKNLKKCIFGIEERKRDAETH